MKDELLGMKDGDKGKGIREYLNAGKFKMEGEETKDTEILVECRNMMLNAVPV